jgi:peptidoglycan LD-endopeptidase LytH
VTFLKRSSSQPNKLLGHGHDRNVSGRLETSSTESGTSEMKYSMVRCFLEIIRFTFVLLAFFSIPSLVAQPFNLPTANRTIYDADGGGEKFFVPTVGKPWTSGCFGCVRTEGWQMHEGLDIRATQRDKRGEAIDPVLSTADGTVVYINHKSALSNFGRYIIVRHDIDGIEVYSTYAHLSEVRDGLTAGINVKSGEQIGVMGRSANTRQGISKERAHLHFELNLLVNERFSSWYKKNFPDQRNDHGQWNGQNFLGIDPRAVLLEQKEQGKEFNLVELLRSQPVLCRVVVRDVNFPWLKRYAPLVKQNSIAAKEGVAGYEIALNFNGIPIELIPRSSSELKSKARLRLLSVNEVEQKKNPCGKIVTKRGSQWELTTRGENLLELLTY